MYPRFLPKARSSSWSYTVSISALCSSQSSSRNRRLTIHPTAFAAGLGQHWIALNPAQKTLFPKVGHTLPYLHHKALTIIPLHPAKLCLQHPQCLLLPSHQNLHPPPLSPCLPRPPDPPIRLVRYRFPGNASRGHYTSLCLFLPSYPRFLGRHRSSPLHQRSHVLLGLYYR